MIIDTNVYSALDRGSRAAIDALRGQTNLYIPIFSIGELRYGFLNGNKQKENEFQLSKFLAQERIDILFPTLKTAEIYGQLATRCRQAGRALSNNDLWIAALASEANELLVTYDKDFAVLADFFGDKLVILND
jgi:predicted nucleic acid-binding protein